MLTTRRERLILLVVLPLALLIGAFGPWHLLPWHADVPSAVSIEEDDPRWDCATMGNRICGTP